MQTKLSLTIAEANAMMTASLAAAWTVGRSVSVNQSFNCARRAGSY